MPRLPAQESHRGLNYKTYIVCTCNIFLLESYFNICFIFKVFLVLISRSKHNLLHVHNLVMYTPPLKCRCKCGIKHRSAHTSGDTERHAAASLSRCRGINRLLYDVAGYIAAETVTAAPLSLLRSCITTHIARGTKLTNRGGFVNFH